MASPRSPWLFSVGDAQRAFPLIHRQAAAALHCAPPPKSRPTPYLQVDWPSGAAAPGSAVPRGGGANGCSRKCRPAGWAWRVAAPGSGGPQAGLRLPRWSGAWRWPWAAEEGRRRRIRGESDVRRLTQDRSRRSSRCVCRSVPAPRQVRWPLPRPEARSPLTARPVSFRPRRDNAWSRRRRVIAPVILRQRFQAALLRSVFEVRTLLCSKRCDPQGRGRETDLRIISFTSVR